MTRIAARLQRATLDVLMTVVVVLIERRMRKAVHGRR
jgi:hypothetical protein